MATTVTPEIDLTFAATAAMHESHIIPSTAYIAVVIVNPFDCSNCHSALDRDGHVNTESRYPAGVSQP